MCHVDFLKFFYVYINNILVEKYYKVGRKNIVKKNLFKNIKFF